MLFSKIKQGTVFPDEEEWTLVPTEEVSGKSFLSGSQLGIGPLWWNVLSEVPKLKTITGPPVLELNGIESSKEETVNNLSSGDAPNDILKKKQRRHFRDHPKNNPNFKRKSRPNPLSRHKKKLLKKIELEDSQKHNKY